MRNDNQRARIKGSILTGLILFLIHATVPAQDKVEQLYREAMQTFASGDPVEASKTFEEIFSANAVDLLCEDYGAQAGGMFFDYAMTLIPQQRWEEARTWFKHSVDAKKVADQFSMIKNENPRENIAKFQLGYAESQLGRHEEALKLYQEYLDSKPPTQEWEKVRNSFVLRQGTSQIRAGMLEEGIATIQQLFDNRAAWQVAAPFLMQGILELGMGWVDNAKAAGADMVLLESIEVKGHAFLDQYLGYVTVEPFDSFRFGFVDRFRKLGMECTRHGLYSLALRFFAQCATIEEIRQDINLRLASLPIGSGVPAIYQGFINQLDEREKAPMHPDAETLRLVANCYDRLGNALVPRGIYWHLAENYPDIDVNLRAEVLHEASRFSAILGDPKSAQYFGEKFEAEAPEDHPLKDNVSTFMLQSLFTSKEYDEVIRVCETVQSRYPLGDPQRELADALYAMSFFSQDQFEEAEKPFDDYMGAYEETDNREMISYYRSTNALNLAKMRSAAEYLEDFLKEFPESELFGDQALADLALSRYNLEDYPAAIAASDKLKEFKPDSIQVPRTLNIEGDSYLIMADMFTAKEQAEQKKEFLDKGLAAYLAASEAAKVAMTTKPDQADYFREVAAEAIWKACDQYLNAEETEKVLAKYDEFFPDFSGTFWEPQISVFCLETLEQNGRAEEGLTQVEKMINFVGNKPPEEQDMDLLRKAIGSYSDASVRVRGGEETLKILDDFPDMDKSNQALLTWLKIQKVIVLQDMRGSAKKDTPEYAQFESRINEVFEELSFFEKANLSEYALQQIGLNFAKGDNPFRAVPYFDELLARQTPEADQFKAPAEFEIGLIEMRNATKLDSAVNRFRRVIDKYQELTLIPDCHLNLAKIYLRKKSWDDAINELQIINREKWMFKQERDKRAEALLLLGDSASNKGDVLGAAKAYLAVFSTYNAYTQFAIPAFQKYARISLEDIKKLPTGDVVSNGVKREKEKALYRNYLKRVYVWQKQDASVTPGGELAQLRRELEIFKSDLNITPEDELAIRFELGIPDDWNPEAVAAG